LTYYLEGQLSGERVAVDYDYNNDNLLTGFDTIGLGGADAPTFSLANVNIDGLGRLKNATETLTKTDSSTIAHTLDFSYDGLSQLTDANIGNISGGNWTGMYSYNKNGDMGSRTINSGTQTDFTYTGNMMASADGNETFSLSYDENGQLIEGQDSAEYTYNWDNKLRSAVKGSTSINLKYDPMGNRIYKNSSEAGARKYIVDIVGDLPVILLELDATTFEVKKAYLYANSQIVAQYDGDWRTPLDCKNFYLHDRLGSVRQIMDCQGSVAALYTYNPFGETIEEDSSFDNNFKFTGQWYDVEIGWYYLRARMYDPHLSRFTGRDPILGKFEEPLTLHKYLYCRNNPLNSTDLTGLWDDGLRYYLAYKHKFKNGRIGMGEAALTLSDEQLEKVLRNLELWSNLKYPYWHGHSDLGYLLGDFDYTRLDHQFWTSPYNPVTGTSLHFMSQEEAECAVGFAIRSGDPGRFEQAMHMGQDWFSHRGKGWNWWSHPFSGKGGHGADYPYVPDMGRTLDSAFLDAQRWTKYMEEIWYLFWDLDTWYKL
jgi:RHS repeat-associated protein